MLRIPSPDFLTKLDLIETHPELFDNRKKKLNFTQEEIEQIRVLVTKNDRAFATRNPRNHLLKKRGDVELKNRKGGILKGQRVPTFEAHQPLKTTTTPNRTE